MPAKSKILVAIGILALGIATSVFDPAIGGLVLSLSALTAAVLWLQGFTRTPAFVRQARQEAAAQRSPPRIQPDVSPQEYRLSLSRPAILLCYFAALVPLGISAYFFVESWNLPKDRGPLTLLGVAMLVFGAVMLLYAYRAPRRAVRINAQGLEADLMVGTRRLAWENILAVASRTSSLPRGGVINDHVVYGPDCSITIPAKLAGRDELMATILTHAPQRSSSNAL